MKNIFKNELLNNFANLLLDNNFRILVPDNPDTWMHFEKDGKLGYCQLSYFKCGISFSTVHKPNKNCGTGFGLDDSYTGVPSPTIEDAERAFILAPNWAKKSDIQHVVKYKGFEEYLEAPTNQIIKKVIVSK